MVVKEFFGDNLMENKSLYHTNMVWALSQTVRVVGAIFRFLSHLTIHSKAHRYQDVSRYGKERATRSKLSLLPPVSKGLVGARGTGS